jgi:putative spermidine/putrescine transport system substrate-binding protein
MSTKHDQLRRLADDLVSRRLGRREFARRALALGVSAPMVAAFIRVTGADAAPFDEPALVAPVRAAQGDQVVISSWGGNFGEAQRAAQFEPFTAETGIEVVLAPQQPEIALIEAQVTSGNVEWDLAGNSNLGAYTLAGKDMLEPLDYSRMDPAVIDAVDEAVKGPNSVGYFYWSTLMGYNLEYFEDGVYPTSWVDFWDVEKFDAPRGLVEMNFEPPMLEIPLLAQGIAPEDLYPLDIDAAFASLDEIRPHMTTWIGVGSDGVQLLTQGELGLAQGGNGALTNAIKDGAPLGMEWNQGLLYYDTWVIPKGAPNQDNAYRFIEFVLRPDTQSAFVQAYPIGAVNPAAYETIPEEVAAVSAGAPDNLAKQVVVDSAWWTETNDEGKTNLEVVYDRWATWILG